MKYNKNSESTIETWLNDFLWSKKIVKTAGHVGRASYKLPTPHLRYSFIDRFLLGTRNNLMFFNTSLTIEETAKGLFLAAKILRNGGRLLIVDTRGDKSPFLDVIEDKVHIIPSAISFSGRRWVGGTVSNWKNISRAVSYYIKNLPRFKSLFSGHDRVPCRYRKMIDAYPGFLENKKEKIIPRLYNLIRKKKWGHKKIRFTRYPDLIFVVNPFDSRHIIDEANSLKIPVIALVDSDCDLNGINIPIPVNNDTMFWVYHCINTLIRLADFVQKTDLPYLQPYPIKEQRPFPSCRAPWKKRETIKIKQKAESQIFSKNRFRVLSKPRLSFKDYAQRNKKKSNKALIKKGAFSSKK